MKFIQKTSKPLIFAVSICYGEVEERGKRSNFYIQGSVDMKKYMFFLLLALVATQASAYKFSVYNSSKKYPIKVLVYYAGEGYCSQDQFNVSPDTIHTISVSKCCAISGSVRPTGGKKAEAWTKWIAGGGKKGKRPKGNKWYNFRTTGSDCKSHKIWVYFNPDGTLTPEPTKSLPSGSIARRFFEEEAERIRRMQGKQ